MNSLPDKPKRGRPLKYSIEERDQAYKTKQKERDKRRYQTNPETHILKSKEMANRYRHAFKILKNLWSQDELKNSSLHDVIKNLLETYTIVDF
jgi:hypothetical protein